MVFVTGDTKVLLADGSEKSVDRIRTGDMLYTDHGSMQVQDVMTGRESEIAEIVFTDGNMLQVAPDQNLLTDRGYCSVRELCNTDHKDNTDHVMIRNDGREVKSMVIK